MESIHSKVIFPGTENSIAMLSFLMGQQSSLLESGFGSGKQSYTNNKTKYATKMIGKYNTDMFISRNG